MHPADPFFRFQNESFVLMRASIYLLKVHLEVISEGHPNPLAKEHNDLTEALDKAYKDPHQYFMSRLFIGHVAAFEVFLQDLLSVVISLHPLKLGATQFKLADILEAGGTEVLVSRAISEAMNKLMYKKPLEYRDAVADLLSIEAPRFEVPWMTLIEAKARRDLGVHANWRCNETYLRKLQEAGLASKFTVGDSTVPETADYLQEVVDALDSLAGKLTNHVLEKIFKVPERVPEFLGGASQETPSK